MVSRKSSSVNTSPYFENIRPMKASVSFHVSFFSPFTPLLSFLLDTDTDNREETFPFTLLKRFTLS